jgi:choline dehydrogenase-like flavoprotein
MFAHPNVFVVDAGFFPTSLGVGPALTIMANALRVAAIVTGEL